MTNSLAGSVQLSPRGVSGSSDTDRISVYRGGKGDDGLYVAIRLSDASYRTTTFKKGEPLYLHATRNWVALTRKGTGRPFYFRMETNGILKMAVLLDILDALVDLSHLEGKGPIPVEVLEISKDFIKLKYPNR